MARADALRRRPAHRPADRHHHPAADEDSQEIFETLNARGTPLTSADLIKNLLFQRLAAEGVDGAKAYRDYWHLFETPFWEKEISVGRFLQPRSAVFLGQWLVSRTGEDIGSRASFSRFKYFVEHEFTAVRWTCSNCCTPRR